MTESSHTEILAQQLAMNEKTWDSLQAAGVTNETSLRLDFMYVAPDEEVANALKDFLYVETDYDLEVVSDRSGFLLKGTTQLTKVDKGILDQWVRWMVTAGLKHGCTFDGWGTEIPE